MPDLYSRAVHESALRSASKKYKSQARGPAIKEFLDKMQSECTSEWHSGRQQCEARSLTGKPCIKGLRTTDEGGAGVVVCWLGSRHFMNRISLTYKNPTNSDVSTDGSFQGIVICM